MPNWKPCGDDEYAIAFNLEIGYEGTDSECVADDSGGWTKFGICQSDGFSPEQIQSLTLDDAKEFYKRHYWHVQGCSLMPASLALEVMDWGVNAGVGQGIGTLQHLIYSSQSDCCWGPKTYNDLKYYLSKHSVDEVVQRYAQYREETYEHWGVGSQAKFLRGWLNRNEDLAQKVGAAVSE